MEEPKIVQLSFDIVEKQIQISVQKEKNSFSVFLHFKNVFFFDLIRQIAIIQNTTGKSVDSAALKRILAALNKTAKSRREDYKISHNIDGLVNCWRYNLTNKKRPYTEVIQQKPEPFTKEEILTILENLFLSRKVKNVAEFQLGKGNITIIPPKETFSDKTRYIDSYQCYIGRRKIDWLNCASDLNSPFLKENITASILNERVKLPEVLQEEREKLFREKRRAQGIKEFPWPGPMFGINSFIEDRANITEKSLLHFNLRPTDYYTFKAIQDNLDSTIFTDENGRQISTREKYLQNINPFSPDPLMAQSISATITLICKSGGQDFALIAKRSKRVGTGADVYVLSVNETLRRKPTDEEIKILEDAPPEYLNPDYDENENPCFFRTVVRGAEEEIGIDLPESDIKFLSFGLETKRYQYALVGIAETDLSIEYIRNAFVKAKDARLEYSGFYFVPFTPEEIYNFMVKYRPWGPEAEYGLYQALLYKFDSNRVRELFEDYPHSR